MVVLWVQFVEYLTQFFRIPSTRKIRIYPLELCATFLSRPPSLNRPELIQGHLLKLQRLLQAAASRFCLKGFHTTVELSCFPLNDLIEKQDTRQESVFMFGSGRPVPKSSSHVNECAAEIITPQQSPAAVKISIIPQVPTAALKIPVFSSKPSIAIKHSIKLNDETTTTTTVKKQKKQAPSEQAQPIVAPVPAKVAKVSDQSKTTKPDLSLGVAVKSVEKLLLEAGICWAMFASFMASHTDAITILQPLQVAQLKQIVKMNPKGSKISGTKSELVERIAALLKAA